MQSPFRHSEADQHAGHSSASHLTVDEQESLEMHLHGVAGGILRRKLAPILQRKRSVVAKALLTRHRQPQNSAGRISDHDMKMVKDCLIGTDASPSSSSPIRAALGGGVSGSHAEALKRLLGKIPWSVIEEFLSPHMFPASYRTGEVVMYPNNPAEAGFVCFLMHGTLVEVPSSEIASPVVQMYLKRCAPVGNFDAVKAVSTQLKSLKTWTAPCVYGLEEALSFAPQPAVGLFAGPMDHTMPSVTDMIMVPSSAFHEALREITSLSDDALTSNALGGGSESDSRSTAMAARPPVVTSASSFSYSRRGSAASRRMSKFIEVTKQSSTLSSKSLHDKEVPLAPFKKEKTELSALLRMSREHCLASKFPLSPDLLRLSWLFQNLPPHALEEILKAVRPVSFLPGAKIAVSGEYHRMWYFLRRGHCVIFPNNVQVHRATSESEGQPGKRRSTLSASGKPAFIGPGSSVGELSLIFEEPRSHTIETSTSCDMWVLDQRSFSDILSSDESLRAMCQRKGAVLRAKWLAAQRGSPELKECLENCVLFRDCWSEVLYTMLVEAMEPLVLPQRTLIASASEFCDRLIIVVKGTASSQRGDVPIVFHRGSVIGETCFVRHRWPFAIAATSIVDCWTLSAEKLRSIAERMDLLQTLSKWDPEAERGKYLTRLNEHNPSGPMFPLDTVALLRRSMQLGVKELIPVLPHTPASLRKRGERSTSFCAHFRSTAMQELELLCVTYPSSFTVSELLFRTSYGGADDHLRLDFLSHQRHRNGRGDESASSSSEDVRSRSPRGDLSSQQDDTDADAAEAQQQKQRSTVAEYASRQKKAAFERSERKKIRRLVGEVITADISDESAGTATDWGYDEGMESPEERLRQYQAHRKNLKNAGANSAVLTHINTGTLNAAQLDADQAVIRRILREQRRRERVTLSNNNALVMSPGMVFGTSKHTSIDVSRRLSHHNSSFAQSGSMFFGGSPQRQSSNSVYSEDDRASLAGSMAGESDYGANAANNILQKMVVPNGVQQWEAQLRSYFTAGEAVIPNLREMMRVFRMRSKKLHQRQKLVKSAAAADSAGAALGKTQKSVQEMFEVVSDEKLYLCVHPSDPEVTIGFQEHAARRHAICVAPQNRITRYIGDRNIKASLSKAAPEETPAKEKTRMLMQLFRAGAVASSAAKTAANPLTPSTSATTSTVRNTTILDAVDDSRQRKPKLSMVHVDDVPSSEVDDLRALAAARDNELNPSSRATKEHAVTIEIPSQWHAEPPQQQSTSNRGADRNGRRGSAAMLAGHRKSTDASSGKILASHFPNKHLFFEHIAQELSRQMSNPLEMLERLQRKYECTSWIDEYASHPSEEVRIVFEGFLERLKKQHTSSVLRRHGTGSRNSLTPNGSTAGTPLNQSQVLEHSSNAENPSPVLVTESSDLADVLEHETSEPHTPSTPDSCSSPALSENNWTEWDGYISQTTEKGNPVTSLEASGAKLSFLANSRRGSSRRASVASTKGSPVSVGAAVDSGDDKNSKNKVKKQRNVSYESLVRYEDAMDDDAEQYRLRLNALRSGEQKPDLEEALALARDNSTFTVFIDGVGDLPLNDEDAAEQNADVAAARRVLQSSARARGGGRQYARDDGEDDEGSLHRAHSNVGRAAENAGGGTDNFSQAVGRFPDARETNMIIRRMERAAEGLPNMIGGDKEEAVRVTDHRLLLAKSEVQNWKRNRQEDDENGTTISSNTSKITKKSNGVANRTQPTPHDVADAGLREHATVPWFLREDAGPDYLTEALAETVPVITRKSRNADGDDGDDSDDSQGEEVDNRERVVLVGSRQFGLSPRPLCKARLLETDDFEAVPPITQLISFSAFPADDDSRTPRGASLLDPHNSSGAEGITSQPGYNHTSSFQSSRPQSRTSAASDADGDAPSPRVVLRNKRVKRFVKSTIAIDCALDTNESLRHMNRETLRVVRFNRLLARVCAETARRRTSVPRTRQSFDQMPAMPMTSTEAILILPQQADATAGTPRYVYWKSKMIPIPSHTATVLEE